MYIKQPGCFSSTDPTLVYKLHKAIYGLKQAPRSWFFKLSQTLNHMGFIASKSVCSLFIKFSNNYIIIILIYVDDIIITGSSTNVIQEFIHNLCQFFYSRGLGQAALLHWNWSDLAKWWRSSPISKQIHCRSSLTSKDVWLQTSTNSYDIYHSSNTWWLHCFWRPSYILLHCWWSTIYPYNSSRIVLCC